MRAAANSSCGISRAGRIHPGHGDPELITAAARTEGLDPVGPLQQESPRRQRRQTAPDHLAIQWVDEAHRLAPAVQPDVQQPGPVQLLDRAGTHH